jgi:hypothetical protein
VDAFSNDIGRTIQEAYEDVRRRFAGTAMLETIDELLKPFKAELDARHKEREERADQRAKEREDRADERAKEEAAKLDRMCQELTDISNQISAAFPQSRAPPPATGKQLQGRTTKVEGSEARNTASIAAEEAGGTLEAASKRMHPRTGSLKRNAGNRMRVGREVTQFKRALGHK